MSEQEQEVDYRVKATLSLTNKGEIIITYDNPGDVQCDEIIGAYSYAIHKLWVGMLEDGDEPEEG